VCITKRVRCLLTANYVWWALGQITRSYGLLNTPIFPLFPHQYLGAMPRLDSTEPPQRSPTELQKSIERICNESSSRRIKEAQNAFSIPRRIPVLRPSRVVLRDLNLQVNKVAAYLQIYGTTPLNACQSCLEGQGPFIQCVVANGFKNGACANCYYDHHESRCSLKR
jgi:hypothetical protein